MRTNEKETCNHNLPLILIKLSIGYIIICLLYLSTRCFRWIGPFLNSFVAFCARHFYDGKIKGKNAWHENQDTPSQSPCMYFYLKNRIQTSNFARQMFQDWKNRFGGSTLSQFQAELRICESRIEKKNL